MWDNYRSFFFSTEGTLKVDFSDHRKKALSLFQAKIVDFDLNFPELKVFRASDEIRGEEVANLHERIHVMKDMVINSGFKSLFGDVGQYVKLPISPYPDVEDCLGLKGSKAFMTIEEGYVNIGYDYKVTNGGAHDCLFNLKK